MTLAAAARAEVRLRDCGVPAARGAPAAAAVQAMWQQADGPGWAGGDGTFSVRLPDGRIAWLFGDTLLAGGRGFVHNSIVVQGDGCLTTVLGGTRQRPRTLLRTAGGGWLWPAQPVVRDGRLLVFLTRVRSTGPRPWGFRPTGTWLARLALPSLRVRSLRPLRAGGRVRWGAAVVRWGGRTYVLGVSGTARKQVHVARVEDSLGGRWTYWDGEGWSDRRRDAAPVASGVSEQLSLAAGPQGLLLVSQQPFSETLRAWRAPVPQGPWRGPEPVATLPVPAGERGYNALLHPSQAAGTLRLVSVNVVPRGDVSPRAQPRRYRPRFAAVEIPGAAAGGGWWTLHAPWPGGAQPAQ